MADDKYDTSGAPIDLVPKITDAPIGTITKDDIVLPPPGFANSPVKEKKKKKKKKAVKKMGGGMLKYGHGGKVRGCGVAKQGVRNARMIKMKGS